METLSFIAFWIVVALIAYAIIDTAVLLIGQRYSYKLALAYAKRFDPDVYDRYQRFLDKSNEAQVLTYSEYIDLINKKEYSNDTLYWYIDCLWLDKDSFSSGSVCRPLYEDICIKKFGYVPKDVDWRTIKLCHPDGSETIRIAPIKGSSNK